MALLPPIHRARSSPLLAALQPGCYVWPPRLAPQVGQRGAAANRPACLCGVHPAAGLSCSLARHFRMLGGDAHMSVACVL